MPDEEPQQQLPYGYAPPPYGYPPQQAGNRFLASRWLPAGVIAASTLWTAFFWLQAALAPSARDQFREAAARGTDSGPVLTGYGYAQAGFLVGVLAWILTCVWLMEARQNALLLRPQGQRRSTAWVWLGWWVPVVAFWFPLQIVQDTRTATAEAAGTRRGDPLLPWWSFWLLTIVGSRVASAGLDGDSGGPVPVIDLAVAVLATIGLLLWIRIVLQVSATQRVLAGRA